MGARRADALVHSPGLGPRPSSSLRDPERNRRARVLRALGSEKSREFRQRHVGRTLRALIQGQPGRKRGTTHGLTGNYLTIFVHATKKEIGDFRNLRVTGHEGGKLNGEFCD